jgi:hypothetical protein
VLTRAIKQAGLSLVVVLVVALLTLLFSFLGTITCAALIGMMLAAMKQPKGQMLLVALVFPAVSYAFSRLSGAELPLEKRLFLALLCLGVFGMSYLLTCGVLLLEKKVPERPDPEVRLPSQCGATEPCGVGQKSRENPWDEPGDLQGKWKRSWQPVNGETLVQVLEFKGNRFSLTVFENDGSIRMVCEGRFEVQELDPTKKG